MGQFVQVLMMVMMMIGVAPPLAGHFIEAYLLNSGRLICHQGWHEVEGVAISGWFESGGEVD